MRKENQNRYYKTNVGHVSIAARFTYNLNYVIYVHERKKKSNHLSFMFFFYLHYTNTRYHFCDFYKNRIFVSHNSRCFAVIKTV